MLLKKKDRPKASYDVIVVGAGLAGLTAANKLARSGRQVLLVESHNKLGGFATWFRRASGDHIFDISLHGFPVGMIKTCRKYWGPEIAGAIKQVSRVRFVNPQYNLETDFTKEHYTELLVSHFKVEREKVDGFFKALNDMNFYDQNGEKNGELFERFFPGRRDVWRFLLEPIVYANGSTLEDPAITYGIVFSNFMSKGVYIYRGGTDEMITRMRDELTSNGVDIKLHTKIDQVVVESGRAVGVMIAGELIRAGAVLSNANLMTTIFKMTGPEHFSPDFCRRAQKVRLNSSSCQVFMGIKAGESIPDVGELIFYSEAPDFNTDELLSMDTRSQTFSLYYPESRPERGERYAIVSSLNARYEDWKKLTEAEYEAQKERVIEKALSALEKIIPGVREKIDYVDCSTPLTVERYTHHQQGSSFGTKFEGLDISMNLHKELPGLFHAGSVGIIMSGWLGAANYGVIQAHEVDNFLDQLEKTERSMHV